MDNNSWKSNEVPPFFSNLLDKLVSIKDLLEKEREALMKEVSSTNKDNDGGVE